MQQGGAQLVNGTPAEALAHWLADAAERPPPPLIAATETVGVAAGVPHGRIFSERFCAPA